MSAPRTDAATAFEVADRLHLAAPWEVFAERSRRYEIHLNGRSIELVRGPIFLEGYGIRIFRPAGEGTGEGFQASTDLSSEGIAATVADAEKVAAESSFPAKKVDLPAGPAGPSNGVAICDTSLWDRPMERLQEYVDALLRPFDGLTDVDPSFGSVRATLTEATLANSAGLRLAYPHTTIWMELAVKASGGPEGRPPGEYWVNDSFRRLEPERAAGQVRDWCRIARDVRVATAPPTGELPVVLPASIVTTILPPVFAGRWTGRARLRELAPAIGSAWAGDSVTVVDDGRFPWGLGSSPSDDEGTPQRRRTLLDHGRVGELLYDARHAGAFGTGSSGNALRGRSSLYADWRRFLHSPSAVPTTIVIPPGDGGSDAEIAESAGDGIWVQQLGWAIPDPLSGAFGGEIRIGYRIRGGKLAEPVRGGTVGGVALAPAEHPSLLRDIASVGSTPALVENMSSPTLLVKNLTVAGAS